MFPSFWIVRPLTFGKHYIFQPSREFSANNFVSRNDAVFIIYERAYISRRVCQIYSLENAYNDFY